MSFTQFMCLIGVGIICWELWKKSPVACGVIFCTIAIIGTMLFLTPGFYAGFMEGCTSCHHD